MKFKVGDKVRRKVEHMSVWWAAEMAKYNLTPDTVFTINNIYSAGNVIILKELSKSLAVSAYRFELVPTVNKRFAKELEE